MINLFSRGNVHGKVLSSAKRLGIKGRPFLTISPELYFGDISKPFYIDKRSEVLSVLENDILLEMLDEDIKKFEKAFSKDHNVCIWYSSGEAEEFCGMLGFIEWLSDKGADIYICDYFSACEDLCADEHCTLAFKPEMRKLTDEDQDKLLKEWAKLKAENTMLRIIRDHKAVSVPEDYFDEAILDLIGDRKVRIYEIYSELYKIMPRMLSFLLYRIHQLIDIRVLELTEEEYDEDTYEEQFFRKKVRKTNNK